MISPSLKQKKILFLINSLGGGGAEHVFIQQLNELHRQGFDVQLATLYQPAAHRSHDRLLELPETRRRCFAFRSFYDLRGICALRRFIREDKIDLVYSTLNEANALSRLISLFVPARIKFIIREANTAEKKTQKFKWWDRMTNRKIDHVIAVSSEVRESLLRYDARLSPKITVLLNGVSIPSEAHASSGSVLQLLSVGRCVEQKWQLGLLQALKQLVEKGVGPFQVHLIGDGVLKKELETYVDETGLESVVRFHGHLPPPEVVPFFRSADIFILSSLWEGCPNVLLEAMSYGITSVATNVGGVPDLLTHGQTGLLVPPKDVRALAEALERLMKDAGLRERLGEAARNRAVEEFAFPIHMERLLAIFSSVLHSSSV